MATLAVRSRAATITFTEEDVAQIQAPLDKLRINAINRSPAEVLEDTEGNIQAMRAVLDAFNASSYPNHVKDAFRHCEGFQAVLDLARGLVQLIISQPLSDKELRDTLDLLAADLFLLAAALQDHWGNRKYFRKRIEDGGWKVLSHLFKQLLLENKQSQQSVVYIRERLFTILLAFGFGREDLERVSSMLKASVEISASGTREDINGGNFKKPLDAASKDALFLHNPEIFPVALELWLLTNADKNGVDGSLYPMLSLFPTILHHVINLSTRNLMGIHKAGILKIMLPMFLDPSVTSSDISKFQKVAVALLKLGVTDLSDAHFLYHNASLSARIAELLHLALTGSPSPAYIHFDLSSHGYASVELPDLGRTFPPQGSSAGYTLSIWLRIVHFDLESHTTIFGAFDSSQTCFVLVYLEKDTRNLILQTSVTSSRPSVRFKTFRFESCCWYHVCLVHRRPRTTTSSKASLFIDGEFVEQVKAHYPSPPQSTSNPDQRGILTPNKKHKPVQAFLGTPQDLATKIGPNLISSEWQLASALLFEEALSDDLIAVHRQLGPRYYGNYQDCLGSFQTYKASTALNIRQENLHPGKEENSDILSAIRSKASALLPETKILLNITAMMVLDDDDLRSFDESQLIKSLSKPAAKNFRNVTRGGRTAIAINGAVPSINDALLHAYGFAILTGDPVVSIPQSLDDASWRIGGCAPISLSLIETANSDEEILRALDILLGTIKENWRNSEAVERENGFGVLGSLLTAKLEKTLQDTELYNETNKLAGQQELGYQILMRILEFVGYEPNNPQDSVIINPLAYRILLIDLDIWRALSPGVQRPYYEQFAVFAARSKHHQSNLKRLARMRIIKKWLDALKSETFYADTIDIFIDAFRSLLGHNPSGDSLRSLALFITYATHTSKNSTPNTLHPTKSIKRLSRSSTLSARRSTLSSASESNKSKPRELTRLQIGTKILEMYASILCQKESTSIKKFARTVTNKWLLHLLSDDEPSVIVLATKILARVLVTNGSSYVDKFDDKTGGFVIMRYRLRRWWSIDALWLLCFAVLFGQDANTIDLHAVLDIYSLMAAFTSAEPFKVVNPGILPVIIAMLESGVRNITSRQKDHVSPLTAKNDDLKNYPADASWQPERRGQAPVMSQTQLFNSSRTGVDLGKAAKLLRTVTQFLADVHNKSLAFRDFTMATPYVQELLWVLYPVVIGSDIVSPETELHSRDSALTFNGSDVIIRPRSGSSGISPIVRTTLVEPPASPRVSRAQPLKRGSSYILVSSEKSQHQLSTVKLHAAISPRRRFPSPSNAGNSMIEEVLEIIIACFTDQILNRKEFPGIGLFMKVPPGFQEHQAYFESFILRNALSSLENTIRLDQKLLWEPRVLTNLARFAMHLGEAVYEGWFIDGADVVIDFLGSILEYVQRPDVLQLKSIRLCSEIITTIRTVISRIALLRLSELEETSGDANIVSFLNKLNYWQTILFKTEINQEEFLKLFCYLLYTKLMNVNESTREAAVNLWRILLVQKSDETSSILQRMLAAKDRHLYKGFQKILELDNASFLDWVDDNREDLDTIFFGLSNAWEEFVLAENRRTEDTAKARISKRQERLRAWQTDDLSREDIIRRHEISSDHWRSNIYASEHLKRQRSFQDQQDGLNFSISSWTRMKDRLNRPCGLFDDTNLRKWQLDQTEGRNRMRLRVIPDRHAHLYNYQAKGAASQINKPERPSLDTRERTPTKAYFPIEASPVVNSPVKALPTKESVSSEKLSRDFVSTEDGFEMVEDFNDESESYEDKNRKVMRSLQRGDQVEHVHNISRIVGLEACEGLLILGKHALYLLDNLFQRSDGEIVNVWQAPPEERDSYLQMISGREVGERNIKPHKADFETRSWRWEDVLSISKRRFLFRDVAIEVFFVDGRSYLLTNASAQLRDELHQRLLAKAQNVSGGMASGGSEDTWRIESLRTPEDNPQTLGSRFTSVFAQGNSNPATRKWLKGEISNFHYLMLVNTMAGRTFNDLTQYPVFPWVIADYTSEELDLTDPRSFRDLTKPMGCQTPQRQAEFKERFQSFAEMGDQNSPAFHYGTHYSSAMIVTSYMIRLQPFVKSYLLLQGGSFDHPDRLFYSIEKAWNSASRDNMTDVRELIPEFFYLPEFLTNSNGYDFGSRQGNGGKIDDVALPRWAHGDPKVFIAKNREALESDYVSCHLHQWIDLIFGQKQRGEAALEATNVFHYLSYRGAKNLDEINDPIERLATIGIIHNFGQTPHQVFQRPHPQREESKHRSKKLDTLADTLTRLPFPLLESEDSVSSLLFSSKHDRLLCSGAFRINIPQNFDKYMEWGFTDGSVRFYATESKKLIGLFEHMHQGQLSCVLFADSRTLATAGTDCTISIWAVTTTAKTIDLTPKACFFGHRSNVTTLIASKSFSTLVSASSDGQVLLWDLNRMELVRKVTDGKTVECAQINDVTGTIMLCRGPEVALFTINGEFLAEQHVCVEGDDSITSCAFYEGLGNEFLERNLIFTGHKRGVVNVWNMTIHEGVFILEHMKRMNHMDTAGFNVNAAMTCILPMTQVVYTGDDDGRVYEWDCIQRHNGR